MVLPGGRAPRRVPEPPRSGVRANVHRSSAVDTSPPPPSPNAGGFDRCPPGGWREPILHCMDTADREGASGSRYRRPYAVPERLDLLQGPSSGTVHLPSHLDWSGSAVYDLDAPGRVVDLYRAAVYDCA